jgi:hypothetical protein
VETFFFLLPTNSKRVAYLISEGSNRLTSTLKLSGHLFNDSLHSIKHNFGDWQRVERAVGLAQFLRYLYLRIRHKR